MHRPRIGRFHPLGTDLAVLIVLAAAARIVTLRSLSTLPWFHFPSLDAAFYDDMAREFARGDLLIGSEPLRGSAAYPYMLGIVYRTLGDGVWPVRVIQAGLGLMLVILTWDTARRLAGRAAALVAGGLVALFGPSLFYEGQLLSDAPSAAIAGLALWMMVRATIHREKRASHWAVIGLTTGATVLWRPNAMLLIVPLIASAAIGSADDTRRRILISALASFALALSVLPARNLIATGRPTLFTSHAGINLYIGNGPGATGAFRVPIDVPNATGPLEQLTAFHAGAERAVGHALDREAADRYWGRRALEFLAAHPSESLALLLWKLRLFWNGASISDVEHYEFTRTLAPGLALPFIQWWFLMPLAMIGTVLALKRRSPTTVVALFNLAWCASLMIVFVTDRYRLPTLPGLAVAAALALQQMQVAWLEASRARRAALAALTAVALLVAWPVGITDSRADLWFRLASDYERAGRLDEARAAYHRVVDLAPDDDRARVRLQRLGASIH